MILKDKNHRISKVGLLQPTAAEWLKQAAATKTQLQHFISQASSPSHPEQRRQCPEALNLQAQGKILKTEYWVKNDPRINHWLSYPGVSVMLQRTQSVIDLLEEISTQAPQKRKDILSPGSTLAETIKEADALLNKIQISSAAMASASVGPVVVSLVLKLLQKADTAILRAGGKSPRVAGLITRMMTRTP